MAFDTLVSAFTYDPVIRWLYPASRQYETHFPVRSSRDWAARRSPTKRVPGVRARFPAVALNTRTRSRCVEQMEATPIRRYPHWYLPWFGVDVALQGKGPRWSADASTASGIVDASHLPGYLETPNPRNISLLRAPRLRGHRRGASRRLPAARVHVGTSCAAGSTAHRPPLANLTPSAGPRQAPVPQRRGRRVSSRRGRRTARPRSHCRRGVSTRRAGAYFAASGRWKAPPPPRVPGRGRGRRR